EVVLAVVLAGRLQLALLQRLAGPTAVVRVHTSVTDGEFSKQALAAPAASRRAEGIAVLISVHALSVLHFDPHLCARPGASCPVGARRSQGVLPRWDMPPDEPIVPGLRWALHAVDELAVFVEPNLADAAVGGSRSLNDDDDQRRCREVR